MTITRLEAECGGPGTRHHASAPGSEHLHPGRGDASRELEHLVPAQQRLAGVRGVAGLDTQLAVSATSAQDKTCGQNLTNLPAHFRAHSGFEKGFDIFGIFCYLSLCQICIGNETLLNKIVFMFGQKI